MARYVVWVRRHTNASNASTDSAHRVVAENINTSKQTNQRVYIKYFKQLNVYPL